MLLAWVLGNAVQLFQTALSSAETYLWTVLIAILLSGTIYKLGRRLPTHTLAYGAWQYVAGISSLCTVAAMGYASVGWRAVHYQQSALPANLQGIDLTVTGTVVGLPQRHADGWRFRFEVKQAVVQDSLQQMALPPLLQVGWYANDSLGQQALPVIRSGQIWHLPLRLKQPHGLLNPGGFDTELWFWQQGIHASASVRTSVRSQTPKLESQTSSWTMGQLRQSARDGIHHSVNDARWAALVSALLVGDQSGLDRADWEVFRATGVAHLMSISGLHITLWAWVARWLIQRL